MPVIAVHADHAGAEDVHAVVDIAFLKYDEALSVILDIARVIVSQLLKFLCQCIGIGLADLVLVGLIYVNVLLDLGEEGLVLLGSLGCTELLEEVLGLCVICSCCTYPVAEVSDEFNDPGGIFRKVLVHVLFGDLYGCYGASGNDSCVSGVSLEDRHLTEILSCFED